ncbi:uncharacterized protein [Littorina saxatilis]|uniref:uncharacterized protein n=1 Tax=Littorina saxatilis TaxID=31220 RepID=UPI0038B4F8AC
MSDMAKKVKFEYDALVLHSDEEKGYAEQFCKHVRKCIVLPGEKSPKITTLDDFSTPGKQTIAILNEAMKDARFIFVSEEYYCTDDMGYFSGNVAIQCKIPDKFVTLKIEGQCFTTKGGGTGKPVLESFCALSIGETWEISESAKKKLEKIFFTESLQSLVDETECLALTHSQSQPQNKVIPEVHSAENLHVRNPSISSASSMQSLDSNETDVKNLASSRSATVDNEATALKVETSGATPHSVNDASDLTSFGDLVDDKEEDVATPHAGVPVADSVPPVRHNQCKDTAAMNTSPQAQNQENLAPNPGIQGQNPGPQVPDQRPQPPTPGPQAPNLDCQAPKQSLAEQSRGSQEAETFDVASSSSWGGTTANPAPTKNRITTFKSLQENQVSVFHPFKTGGRSMLGAGAAGGSVSSNPDDVAARRERHAKSAEKRLRDAKEGDN